LLSAGWNAGPGETSLGWATTAYTSVNKGPWNNNPGLTYANAANSLFGASRSTSADIVTRLHGLNVVISATSQVPFDENIFVYAAPNLGYFSAARLAFYSIGESLDLALLDTRVTSLINAFAAAIP
jgi:hypothetical protein